MLPAQESEAHPKFVKLDLLIREEGLYNSSRV